MSNLVLKKEFSVSREDITHLGDASTQVKTLLKQIGFANDVIRRVAISMYEGEVNMAIHAGEGTANVEIYPNRVEIVLTDNGPGIQDIEKAMKEGYSTASSDAQSLGFGAGMGLANMKKNSDQMELESQLGKGTTVTMTILA